MAGEDRIEILGELLARTNCLDCRRVLSEALAQLHDDNRPHPLGEQLSPRARARLVREETR